MADTETDAPNRLHRRVHKRVRHHYFRIMPNNPHHRAVVWTVFWIVSGIILVQLMYPPTRAVPTAVISGEVEAWQDEVHLAARITKLFDTTSLSLQLGEQSVDVPLKELGAAPETATMVSQLTAYPFWQRYIPLSVFWQPAQLNTATVTYTNAITTKQCQLIAAELSYPPTNARLELSDGKLIATDEEAGKSVDPSKLCQAIQLAKVKLGDTTKIAVEADTIMPERVSADFVAVRQWAERALSREISFMHGDDIFQPTQEKVASWLQLEGDDGATTLRLDKARLKDYLESINKQIGKPAGTTNVRVVNGSEVSREDGQPGERIDYDEATSAVQAQLLDDATSEVIALDIVDIAPTVVYNNRYTATEAGLQAYISDAASDYNARIMVRQLEGEGWEAAARQHESIPSASTYKLYVAMWLFDQMEQGKTNWGSPILDTNVSTCFDRMTIASTNACSQEWLSQAGRQAFNDYLYSRGVSRGTTFTSPIAVHTTAADLTNHMTKLERGELYDDVYRQRLYHSLSTHPYRYGIATGSSGQVYDKVGFLWDYVHDTGVVKHPRGTYVVTIMTKGQSYARIASITREIERIMYP